MPIKDKYLKSNSLRTWINQRYREEDLLKLLADPDNLLNAPDCQIIKNQRKVKIGRIILNLESGPLDIYVKRYNIFSWRSKLEYIFRRSKAFKAWRGAKLLLQHGFNTADPIAAIEFRRFGILEKSFFISQTIPQAEISVFYYKRNFLPNPSIKSSAHRNFIRGLAKLFGTIHKGRMYHQDLKDYNILVSEQGQDSHIWWLIDTECVSTVSQISYRRKVKNLGQLNRSLGKLVSNRWRMAFFLEYLKHLGWNDLNRQEKRSFIREILEETRYRDNIARRNNPL